MASGIVGGAPIWVWFLLVGLIVMGVRRLRTRETPVAVALIPVVAFLGWSVVGVVQFAGHVGVAALLPWVGGLAIGAASALALPDAPATRLAGGRVRQPGSPAPLFIYLGVFVARFGCGAWAAIRPADARTATAVGIAVGAAAAGRFAAGALRWRADTMRA